MAEGKNAKLTPEEKLALQTEKKQLKKLEQEEKQRQIIRDKLTRELQYSEQSGQKLIPIWREIMTKTKLEEIGIECEYAVNVFEMVLDNKDYTISLLIDELQDAEYQYSRNFTHSCQQMENIYKLYQLRLCDLQKRYDIGLAQMKKKLRMEIKQESEICKNNEDNIKTIMFGLDIENRNIDKLIKSDYLSKLNIINEKAFDEMCSKRIKIVNTFESKWNLYNEILNNFLSTTEIKRKEYWEIQEQDKILKKKCFEQAHELFESQVTLIKLNEEQTKTKDDFTETIHKLENERNFFADAVTHIRKVVKNEQEQDRNQLTLLVSTSNVAIEKLVNLEKKANKFLQLIAINRKYETQKEKILPLPKYMPTVSAPITTFFNQELTADRLKNLDMFWKKCANIDATRHVLNEEQEYLLQLNRYLKEKITENFKSNNYGSCKFPPIVKPIKKNK